MITAEVSLGEQTRLDLREAILLYKDDQKTLATVHEVSGSPPTLGPGSLLTLGHVRALHQGLYGEMPLEVLPEHVLALSSHKLVWFEKPKKRVMFFQSSDLFLQGLSGQAFWQPALLFVASLRSLQVYALASSRRPSAQTPLYVAPYYNTSRAQVCLGSTEMPTTLSVRQTKAYSRAFFQSAFTHGTAERLVQGWGGSYGEFWQFVKRQKTFPTRYLVPFGRTLEEMLCQPTR